MPEIEITCQYIDFAKPPKRRGKIKSSEGDQYWADNGMLSRFQKGEVCTIEYDTAPKEGGGEWRTIKRKISTSPTSPPPSHVRDRTNPTDSKQIFVTALLKGMTTPQDTQASITAKGNMLKAAYENLFGTPAKQETEAMLNDEIPENF